MTSGVSVKSFLIADLLEDEEVETGSTDTNKDLGKDAEETKNVKNGEEEVSIRCSSSISNISTGGGSPSSTRIEGSTTSSNDSVTTEEDKKWSVEGQSDKPGSSTASSSALGMFQYPSFPMGYTVPDGHARCGESDAGGRGYASLFPLGYDYRQSGLVFGRNQNSIGTMMIPLVGGMTQPGIEFPLHHIPGALFGMPVASNLARYQDKGGVHVGRDTYGLFPVGRSFYGPSGKRKGGQIRFSNSQTAHLEKAFVHQKYLNASERKRLAHSLGLSDRQVKTWFQNRRAKLRKCKRSGYSEDPEQVQA